MTPRQARIKRANTPIPTEKQDQNLVAAWLDAHRINWFHPPNEGRHKIQYRMQQARKGMKKGVPDIIVIDPPPALPGIVGCAIELKRRKQGVVSDEQHRWLEIFRLRNWYTAIALGADHAIEMLERLGYGKRH